MQQIMNKLYAQQSLTQQESQLFFDTMIKGEMDPIVLAAALTALKIKTETPDEIAGAAAALIENAKAFPRPDYDFADIVGTGGDGANLFNVSSASSFIVAAAGGTVAKHGNRGVSSKSGSADLLEAAGVNLNLTSEQVARCLFLLGFDAF